MALSVYGAAKTERGGVDIERGFRQPGLGIERVVAARRDVVRGVGMEERGQHLHLATTDAELVLTTAVGAHPALLAELIALEERLDRAEARRLEVDRARDHLAGENVLDAVDRRVPGDPVLV